MRFIDSASNTTEGFLLLLQTALCIHSTTKAPKMIEDDRGAFWLRSKNNLTILYEAKDRRFSLHVLFAARITNKAVHGPVVVSKKIGHQ